MVAGMMDAMVAHRAMGTGEVYSSLHIETDPEPDTMPQSQSLPTSGTDVLSAQSTPVPSSMVHSSIARTLPSTKLSINTETVLSSVRDSLRASESPSSSRPRTPVQDVQNLDFVVIPSEASPVLSQTTLTVTTMSQMSSVTETSPSGSTSKVSEVAQLENDVFNQSGGTVDLEPYRYGVMSARRRSVQFYTLVEVDETEEKTISAVNKDEQQIPMYRPIFSIGDSLRKLCYPKPQLSPLQRVESMKAESNMGTCGYQSDPEECVRLYKQVHSEQKSMKRNKSTSSLVDENGRDNQEAKIDLFPWQVGRSHSKSLPVTPRVSPKIKRKNTGTEAGEVEKQDEKRGAGFTFLSRVAGELSAREKERSLKSKQFVDMKEKHRKGQVEATQNNAVVKDSQSQVVNISSGTTAVAESSASNNTVSEKLKPNSDNSTSTSDIPDGKLKDMNISPKKEKKNFLKSFVSWGTTSKVKVTNKETNMFSPTSF